MKKYSEESSVTEEKFQCKGIKYERLYFHEPISYKSILQKYQKNILNIKELLELRKEKKKETKKKVHTWNLCKGIFKNQDLKEIFKQAKKGRYKVYLGKKPSKDEERVCLISPNNTLFLDAKPNWKTFGFGIIITKVPKR